MKKATELEFLRFFYKRACSMFADGGTDEKYWIEEEFEEETGKTSPYAEEDEE